jgi:hypothetical protein
MPFVARRGSPFVTDLISFHSAFQDFAPTNRFNKSGE